VDAVLGDGPRTGCTALVIDQADTLDAAAVRGLKAMEPFFDEKGAPVLRVILVGTAQDGLGRGVALAPAAVPALPAQSPPAQSPPVQSPAVQSPPVLVGPARKTPDVSARADAVDRPSWRRLPAVLAGVAVLAVLGVACAAGLRAVFYRQERVRPTLQAAPQAAVVAPMESAEPPAAPMPIVPDPATPSAPVVPRAPDVAQAEPSTPVPAPDPQVALRREFEQFLTRSGVTASINGPERDGLFQEFLAWRQRGRAGLARDVAAVPRVVIQVPSGYAAADEWAARLQRDLGRGPGTVELHHVPSTPDRPGIRYYHPEDLATARRMAADLGGGIWTIRDMTGFQPRPPAGTIEVWLPRP